MPSSPRVPPRVLSLDQHQQMLRLQYGEMSALKELYDGLGGITYRICLRMLNSPQDAEETVQDTFLRLAAQAHRYDAERGAVQTFVLTIAHHLCLERLRARQSRPQLIATDLTTLDFGDATSQHDPLDKTLIGTALHSLPDTDRVLLEAMFFDGYTHAELTKMTGIPLGTVKSRLRRALLKLRERMNP